MVPSNGHSFSVALSGWRVLRFSRLFAVYRSFDRPASLGGGDHYLHSIGGFMLFRFWMWMLDVFLAVMGFAALLFSFKVVGDLLPLLLQ